VSEDQPRISSVKVTLAVLGAVALLFVGCVQISTQGQAFNVSGNAKLFGGAYLIAGAALVFWLYRIAFKSKPSFVLHGDRIEFYGQPTHFRDIDEVVFTPAEIWLKRPPQLFLRLRNGSVQHLPYGLMTHGPEAFAELLSQALARYRIEETSPPVTGP